MASCQTAQWSSPTSTPYVKLTVTESASAATTSTLSWTLQYVAPVSAAQTGAARAYSVVIAGETVKSGSYDINGKVGTYTIASGTKTINKTTSAQNIAFSVSFNFNLTWSGVYGGTKSASGSISVAAKTSYAIKYNANGGTGAPSQQTKWHGTNLTLSSTKPTRTGYTFQGWATSASGAVAYAAGASYTANAAATLYAVWKANTYAVTYNANGGTGAPSAQTKTYGTTLTLSSTKPTRTNYTFKGWGTSASATTVAYAAGASYTTNAAITLYAIWELAYTEPTITNLSIARCTSNGTTDDFGTYARVKFSWSCSQLAGTNNVASIKINRKVSTATSWTSQTVTASGTSGNVDVVIGSGALSIDSIYDIAVVVTDSKSGSTTLQRTLATATFPLDILAGGKGVAIGKAATEEAFDVYMQTIIRGSEDASGSSASGQLIVGDPNGNHLAMDNNEIMAKSNATTPSNITINYDGGNVGIGGDSSKISLNGTVYMKNGKALYGTNTSGAERSMMQLNASNQMVFGYGSYANNEGATYFDGNAVNIRSKGAIAITSPTAGLSARHYGVNKILWSGGYYMTAPHIATLSEGISAQPHGVVLVFSRYSSGSQNDFFSHVFVPKAWVSSHPGCPMWATCINYGIGHMAKYLWVANTEIKGHADNDKTLTCGGVTFNGLNWVLRYVIGV